MSLKFTVKKILDEQNCLANICSSKAKDGNWTDKTAIWIRDSDQTDIEYEETVAFYNNLREKAIKYWELHELEIDDTKAIIELHPDANKDYVHLNWKPKERFVLMGEIYQAPGHIMVFCLRLSKMFSMVHTDNFLLVPPEIA